MVGFLLTALFCLGVAGVGRFALRNLIQDLDPALQFGVSGLGGLGIFGTLSLPILLLPGGASWGTFVVGALALAGFGALWKFRSKFSPPKGAFMLVILAAGLVALCSLIAVLAPSDSFDWDTLAYHLAVPKLWISTGQMHYISYIHHSNFPGVVDDLYVWGLNWGGEAGAKAFSWMFGFFGAFLVFGAARSRYSAVAGWWALLAYVGIPLVGWEAGTAYVDLSNGLFVAGGILFGALYLEDTDQTRTAWLSGVFLGLAAASKYTGLQNIFAIAFVGGLLLVLTKQTARLKTLAGAIAIAVAICSPWYVKNIINTGNPVYPFFCSVFKGKNWDAFSDAIYKNQQQTFGAGRAFAGPGQDYTANPLEPVRIGGAALGLAYQPGRYTDPQPTQGGGFPFESLGAIPIAALLLWMFSGKLKRFEIVIVASVGVSLGMWFFLSEQSRYVMGLFLPACVLAGGAVSLLRMGPLLAGASIVQLLGSVVVYTRYGDPDARFAEKLKVVIGGQTAEDYQKRFLGFYEPAQELNSVAKGGRVALFDEVFGYLLDVPYFWANPGHSTEIGYEQLTSADEFMASLHKLGITYVYINLGETFGPDKTLTENWIQHAGISGPATPDPDRANEMKDPRSAYKVLLAEAIAKGDLTLYKNFGSRLIFTVGH